MCRFLTQSYREDIRVSCFTFHAALLPEGDALGVDLPANSRNTGDVICAVASCRRLAATVAVHFSLSSVLQFTFLISTLCALILNDRGTWLILAGHDLSDARGQPVQRLDESCQQKGWDWVISCPPKQGESVRIKTGRNRSGWHRALWRCQSSLFWGDCRSPDKSLCLRYPISSGKHRSSWADSY